MWIKENKRSFLYRRKNHEYLRLLNHNLSFENWHSVHKAVNVNEAYDNFFMEHHNTSFPIVKVVHKNESQINLGSQKA